MSKEIKKIRLKCKSGVATCWDIKGTWVPKYVAGNWYDCEYEPWHSEESKRINGGYLGRKYWVYDELGQKNKEHNAQMQIAFGVKDEDIRQHKIDEILTQ